MERHLDLIRTILLETEQNPSPLQPIEMRAPRAGLCTGPDRLSRALAP